MESYQLMIIREIATPLMRRVGTALAAYLVAVGATQPETNAIMTGLAAGAAVLWDLALSYINRKG